MDMDIKTVLKMNLDVLLAIQYVDICNFEFRSMLTLESDEMGGVSLEIF